MVGKSSRGRSGGRCGVNTFILHKQEVSGLGLSGCWEKLSAFMSTVMDHKSPENVVKFSSVWRIFISSNKASLLP